VVRLSEFVCQIRFLKAQHLDIESPEGDQEINEQALGLKQHSFPCQYKKCGYIHRIPDKSVKARYHEFFGWRKGYGCTFAKNYKAMGTPKVNGYAQNNGNQPNKTEYSDIKKVTGVGRYEDFIKYPYIKEKKYQKYEHQCSN